MKLNDYLKEKWGLLTVFMLTHLNVAGIFHLYEVPLFISVSFYFTTFFLVSLYLGYDFFRRRKYYLHTFLLLKELDEKYLLSELLPEGSFMEARFLKEVLQITDKSMREHVNEYAFSMEEYKEYIEMWIHEVKTPLASTRLLIENNPNSVTKSMNEELDKLEAYLTQALFYARSHYLEKDFIIKKLELKKIVQTALKRHVKDFSTKKIKLDLENISGSVYSDQKWLDFMLNQIIGNGVKYMSAHPRLSLYTTHEPQSLTLHIQDNGIGIPSQDIKRIFEKGFTGENGRIYGKSTGIGLYLCHKMAKQLGISIYVKSEVGVGTCLSLTFPISDMYFK